MKKSKWILISLSSLAVLLLSAFIIVNNQDISAAATITPASQSSRETETIDALFGVLEDNYRLSNLPYNYTTEDIYGNKKNIINLAKSGRKIVLRYSELNCNVCVDSAFAYFNKFSQKVGAENVILLVEYKSADYLAQLIRLNHLVLPNIYRIIDIDKSERSNNPKDAPFLFVLDSSGQMKDVFYPLKELPSLSELYYNTMFEKYFKS